MSFQEDVAVSLDLLIQATLGNGPFARLRRTPTTRRRRLPAAGHLRRSGEGSAEEGTGCRLRPHVRKHPRTHAGSVGSEASARALGSRRPFARRPVSVPCPWGSVGGPRPGAEAPSRCSEAALGAAHPGRGGRGAGRSALGVPRQREAQALLPLAEERGGPGAGGEARPRPVSGGRPEPRVGETRSLGRGSRPCTPPGKGGLCEFSLWKGRPLFWFDTRVQCRMQPSPLWPPEGLAFSPPRPVTCVYVIPSLPSRPRGFCSLSTECRATAPLPVPTRGAPAAPPPHAWVLPRTASSAQGFSRRQSVLKTVKTSPVAEMEAVAPRVLGVGCEGA